MTADQLLWRVLSLLVQHDGQVKSGAPSDKGGKSKSSSPPSGQLLPFRDMQSESQIEQIFPDGLYFLKGGLTLFGYLQGNLHQLLFTLDEL